MRAGTMVWTRAPQLQPTAYALVLLFCLCYLIYTGTRFSRMSAADRRDAHRPSREAAGARKNLSCFIITLDPTLEAVRLKEDVVCHPFLGRTADPYIFSHVDPQVQQDLLRHTSSRGAHYTNNKSVSIAWNHMRLWQKLARTDGSQDLLVFEDDAIVTNHSVDVYRALQSMGIFRRNYIIKLVNVHAWWFGKFELSSIRPFSVGAMSYVLKKCGCRTRQNLYNSGAYVLDRHAAQILLDKFLPMRFHVDVYVHYTGYEFSNVFVVEQDAVRLSDRASTHQSANELLGRTWPDLKELLMNIMASDC